ncbi:putative cytochrome P450 [Mycobacteroides abscessus subsp. abscessus]|nr:putative cytochrome P450 [Mycobacteroides abscessus subsp. abscessus]
MTELTAATTPVSCSVVEIPAGKVADPFHSTRHPLQAVRSLLSDRKPPRLTGPRGLPVVGVWPEYNRSPHEFLLQASKQYGDIFRLPLPFGDVVYVNHPELAKRVLTDEDRFEALPSPLLGFFDRYMALFPAMRREEYHERRRSFMSALSRRSLSRSSDAIVNGLSGGVQRWDSLCGGGEYVNLTPRIAQVTLPMVLRAMIATEFDAPTLAQMDSDLSNLLSAASLAFLPWTFRPKSGRALLGSARRSYRLFDAVLQERLAHPTSAGEHPDMLDVILSERRPGGELLRHHERVSELIIVMTGAYDTIVSSVSWTLAQLILNPDALERLRTETDEVLQGRAATFDDIGALKWTKACFDEAQRLQGGPMHPRFATTDTELAGHSIPKDTIVGVGWYSQHMDPRWWPDPQRYDPTRFFDPQISRARPNEVFLPFSIGVHQCPGMGMAYLQGTLLVANVVQRYDFSLPTGWRPRHDYRGATTIAGGLPVKLSRRTNNQA